MELVCSLIFKLSYGYNSKEQGSMLAEQYLEALSTMGESGIGWIDGLFKLCVIFLVDLADILGISYEEINIYIFVIIWPCLTLYQTLRILMLRRSIRKLKQRI
jgi:hypothetical protein